MDLLWVWHQDPRKSREELSLQEHRRRGGFKGRGGTRGRGGDPGKGRALGKGRDPDLLHVVDLIMLAFLVASDLALRLLSQLAQVLL